MIRLLGGALLFAASMPTLAADPVPAASVGTLVGPALRVSDVARSIGFYTQGLGLVVGRTIDRGGASEVILRFAGEKGAPAVVLLHDAAPGKSPPIVAGTGYQRTILKLADVTAVQARLRAAGYPAGELHTSDIGPRVLMIRDPDGYAYELVEASSLGGRG